MQLRIIVGLLFAVGFAHADYSPKQERDYILHYRGDATTTPIASAPAPQTSAPDSIMF